MTQEGDVWAYPYLWRWQSRRGETGGRKVRPCVLALKVSAAPNDTRILLLAITSKKPHETSPAIPIPDTEKRRANLDAGGGLWIILGECNIDSVERSFYLESSAKIGSFSPVFIVAVKEALLSLMKSKKIRAVKRTD